MGDDEQQQQQQQRRDDSHVCKDIPRTREISNVVLVHVYKKFVERFIHSQSWQMI